MVGLGKTLYAVETYKENAEAGLVNPIADGYNLATSTYNGAVKHYSDILQTKGLYATIRERSANVTEVS